MSGIAIYAGTFDPLTFGHLDLIERSTEIFEHLIVAASADTMKQTLFSAAERVAMIESVVAGSCYKEKVEVEIFDGLLINYARSKNIRVIIRGLRAYSDFEYEFQMALMNRRLNREVQTVFLMTGLRWIYTSSSIIKQAAQFGGSIKGMVPPLVEKKIREKYRQISE